MPLHFEAQRPILWTLHTLLTATAVPNSPQRRSVINMLTTARYLLESTKLSQYLRKDLPKGLSLPY